jgi:hypothetical protein
VIYELGKRGELMVTVVLDANIWIKERLLRSEMGAALLYTLRRTNGILLLPDTTRIEIQNGVQKQILEKAEKISENLITMRALLGRSPEFTCPTREEMQTATNERLSSFGSLLHVTAHNDGHLEAALQRVINHLPPAHKQEEFRDCLLWEICLDLACSSKDDFVILTEDRAFYQNDKAEAGISNILSSELNACGANIILYPSVNAFLSTLEEDVRKPDIDLVSSALHDELASKLIKSLDNCSFGSIEQVDPSINAFFTEVPDVLAIDFKLKYVISDLELQDGVILPVAYGIVEGSAAFNVHTSQATNVQLTAIRLESTEGVTLRQSAYAYMSGGLFGGPRYTQYSLRRKI